MKKLLSAILAAAAVMTTLMSFPANMAVSSADWSYSVNQSEVANTIDTSLIPSAPTLAEPQWNAVPEWHGFNLMQKYAGANGAFSEEDFKMISSLGFNFVRLPMDYTAWTTQINWDNLGHTLISEGTMEQIDKAIEYGIKYGVHVQICFHKAPGYCVNANNRDEYDLWTDEAAQSMFVAQWEMFARRYDGIPSKFLSFNLVNEPDGVSDADYSAIMGTAINAIRAIDNDRFIMADGIESATVPVNGLVSYQVAQSFHGYEPSILSLYGSDAGITYPDPVWPMTYRVSRYISRNGNYSKTLEINGSFNGGKIGVYLNRVSQRTTFVIKADGAVKKTQVVSPSTGSQDKIDHSVWVDIPEGTEKLTLEVTAGDWVSFGKILINDENDNLAYTIIGNEGWGSDTANVICQSGNVYNVGDGGTADVKSGKDILKEYIQRWVDFKTQTQVDFFCGEFGVDKRVPHNTALEFTQDKVDAFNECDVSGWALWRFEGNFGIASSGRTDATYATIGSYSFDIEMLGILETAIGNTDWEIKCVNVSFNDGTNPVNLYGINLNKSGGWVKNSNGTYTRTVEGVTVTFDPSDETVTLNGTTKVSQNTRFVYFTDMPINTKKITYSCSKDKVSGTCSKVGDNVKLLFGFSTESGGSYKGLENGAVNDDSRGGAYFEALDNYSDYTKVVLGAYIPANGTLTFDNCKLKVSVVEGGTRDTFGPMTKYIYNCESLPVPESTEGKVFDGYYTEANGGGTKFYGGNGTPLAAANDTAWNSLTPLYANWIYPDSVTVTFEDGKNFTNKYGVDLTDSAWERQLDGTYKREYVYPDTDDIIDIIYDPKDDTFTLNGEIKAGGDGGWFNIFDYKTAVAIGGYTVNFTVVSGACTPTVEGGVTLRFKFIKDGGIVNDNAAAGGWFAVGSECNNTSTISGAKPNVTTDDYTGLALGFWKSGKTVVTFSNFKLKFSVVEGNESSGLFGPIKRTFFTGGELDSVPVPTYSGKTFKSYYSNRWGSNNVFMYYDENGAPVSNAFYDVADGTAITLTAYEDSQATAPKTQIKIILDNEGETEMIIASANQTAVVPNPVKEGETFVGWECEEQTLEISNVGATSTFTAPEKSIRLTAKYQAVTHSLDITWGAMDFTYTKEWESESLAYVPMWTSNDNDVSVTNTSSVDVNVKFDFSKAQMGDSFTVKYLDTSDNKVMSSAQKLAVNSTVNVKVNIEGICETLEGDPDKELTIGTITVSIVE